MITSNSPIFNGIKIMNMFSVFEINEGGFDKIILQNETSKVEIIPNCGGILNAWHVLANENVTNVIDGYDDEVDFKENCETKGFRSVKLSPFVCRLDAGKYTFRNKAYEVGKFALNGDAIHGLVYDANFEKVHQQADDNGAMVQLEYCYAALDNGYPFQYTIMLEYLLETDNQLTLTTYVMNQHDSEIPIADGWHPYFKLGGKVDDLMMKVATDEMVEFNVRLLPTGKTLDYKKFQTLELLGDTFLDNCFLLSDPLMGLACTLENRKEKIKLEIFAGENYPFLQIYTPPHRNSIAIENLSAAPDAFNNRMGLVYLQPNSKEIFTTTYKVSTLN